MEDVEDKSGNIPLQYLSAKTPVSAIKVLDELSSEGDADVLAVSVLISVCVEHFILYMCVHVYVCAQLQVWVCVLTELCVYVLPMYVLHAALYVCAVCMCMCRCVYACA